MLDWDEDCAVCREARETKDNDKIMAAWANHQTCLHPDCSPHGPAHDIVSLDPERTTTTVKLPELQAGVYEHWKGHYYLVLGYAQISTNDDEPGVAVVYVGLHTDGIEPSDGETDHSIRMRVRRVEEFFEMIDPETGEAVIGSGTDLAVPRFKYVGHSMPGI